MKRSYFLGVVLMMGLSATVALGGVITVNNPSFETLPVGGLTNGCGTGCAYSINAAIPSWTATGSFFGQFQPGPPATTAYFNTLASDGSPTDAYSDGGTIAQTVGVTVVPGLVYTLMVDLGHRNDTPFVSSADLFINGNRYIATGTTPTAGNWATYTVAYTGLSADAGAAITIELQSDAAQGNFDNVRLSSSGTALTPEPAFTGLAGGALILLAAFGRRKIAK